ncbi:hypothetical protein SEVIR_6G260350v4 [Setaria viridis]
MSLFSLNCRGAGNASTVRELRDFITKFAPSILCILETQISKIRVEALAGTLGFDRAFAVGSEGRSGGLCIFWNNDLDINILGHSKYHIDASVMGIGDLPWRITTVYGEAQTNLRSQTWDTLKNICGTSTLPWLCLGDFNEVLRPEEHLGVGHRALLQMQGFCDMVDVCNLIDLGYSCSFWTWEKKVVGGTYTQVRLDRALGSAEWSAQFPFANVCHINEQRLIIMDCC